MLHEPASTPTDNPSPIIEEPVADVDPTVAKYDTACALIADVFQIEKQFFLEWTDLRIEDRAIIIQGDVEYLLTVEGHLKIDSEVAYDTLEAQLHDNGMTALFREEMTPDGKVSHRIHVLDGLMKTPDTPSPIPNIILLLMTLASVL